MNKQTKDVILQCIFQKERSAESTETDREKDEVSGVREESEEVSK